MKKLLIIVFSFSVVMSQHSWNIELMTVEYNTLKHISQIEDQNRDGWSYSLSNFGLMYSPTSDKPYTGKVFSLDPSGQIKEEWDFENGVIWAGTWTAWYDNGNKRSEGTYLDGELDGKYTQWWKNGEKKSEETYKDSYRVDYKRYNEEGKLKEYKNITHIPVSPTAPQSKAATMAEKRIPITGTQW